MTEVTLGMHSTDTSHFLTPATLQSKQDPESYKPCNYLTVIIASNEAELAKN